jgi:hypothetical protein
MPTYQRFSLFYAAALFQFRNLIWTGVMLTSGGRPGDLAAAEEAGRELCRLRASLESELAIAIKNTTLARAPGTPEPVVNHAKLRALTKLADPAHHPIMNVPEVMAALW